MNNRRFVLTLKYTALMSAVLCVSLIIIYAMSEHARHQAFRHMLQSEAITKVNLYLEHRVDAETMQHIYLNNMQFINEVEVAVYTPDFVMLYHDAAQHDIVKESSQMISEICSRGQMDLDVADAGYQAVGLLYDGQYVVTAAAHDGYGEANLAALRGTLLIIFVTAIILMLLIGYALANMTIKPIERALASQKMLVSNVSHELRTPLASIIGELDLALQHERTPRDYAARIGNALNDAHRMSDIIVGLLNMARAEYDQSQIKLEPIRIDELLMEVREGLLRANSDYHINVGYDDSLTSEGSEHLLCIEANHYLLALALRNLMENNCKYSADHTSTVTLCQSDGHLALAFVDRGIGMSSDELAKIFTPFFRAQSHGVDGHGIGMALAQRIIALHRGQLKVISKQGHGTTFWLRL